MKVITKIKIILIAISIPIIVAVLLEFNLFWKVKTDNDWIGFYASYIGSIIGVFGVFEVMRIDQKKREEERKDELFLNNLQIYKKITSLIHVEKLSKLKERLREIRSETNWDMVDSSTRNKLKQIEGNLDYSDESNGLFYTIRCFLRRNLYDELKVTLSNSGDEFNESFEYEEVPDEILDVFTNIVLRNSEIELTYENIIEISISKDKLLEQLEENSYTKGHGNKINAIYRELSNIKESNEWSDYISKRSTIYEQIRDLRNHINNRIEKVLNY